MDCIRLYLNSGFLLLSLQKLLCLRGPEEHHMYCPGWSDSICEGGVHHQMHMGSEVSCCHVSKQNADIYYPETSDSSTSYDVMLCVKMHNNLFSKQEHRPFWKI